MIKASELRIGNLISERDNHRTYKILEIQSFGVSVRYWSCGAAEVIRFNKLMPILLTTEILEKCGFENSGPNYELGDVRVYFSLRNGLMLQEYYRRTVEDSNIKGCFYLHQLQNLYFALTGVELTINL